MGTTDNIVHAGGIPTEAWNDLVGMRARQVRNQALIALARRHRTQTHGDILNDGEGHGHVGVRRMAVNVDDVLEDIVRHPFECITDVALVR